MQSLFLKLSSLYYNIDSAEHLLMIKLYIYFYVKEKYL
jgi:hypothetical protein